MINGRLDRIKKRIAITLIDLILLMIVWIVSEYIINLNINFKQLYSLNFIFISVFYIILLYAFKFYRFKLDDTSLTFFFKTFPAFIISFFISLIFLSLINDFKSSFRFLIFYYLMSTMVLYFYRGLYKAISVYGIGNKAYINKPKAIIYGAGEIGEQLARLYFKNKFDYNIIGFIDDDIKKIHNYCNGIMVLGGITEIKRILKNNTPDVFIIAITDIQREKVQEIMNITNDFHIKLLIVPTMVEIHTKEKKYNDIREISYNDLLGRKLIEIDKEPIMKMVRGKRVLVTGACGTIGEEICIQLKQYNPSALFLLDIDESGLHDLSLKLNLFKEEFSNEVFPICADIKNKKKLDRILNDYKIDIIFHAAAYKHVPMMEYYPEEAINTNIGGTYNLFTLAVKHKVSNIIVISTDKAVRPTNVMGATKRVVELMATSLSNEETKIVCVRFGNVLGSRGSMLPLFVKQIQEGIPITVTHKEIIRYFMALPEAVGLVFLAATLAKSGEVMVLDMGHPINIYEFAKKLIKYFGNGNSVIDIIGLRPGEKLYEELLTDEDYTIATTHKLVKKAKIIQRQPLTEIKELIEIAKSDDVDLMLSKLEEIVPEFERKEGSKINPKI